MGHQSEAGALRSPVRPKSTGRRAARHTRGIAVRAIAAVEAGASYRQAAARYGVSASTIVKWAQRFRQTGSVRLSLWVGTAFLKYY